jgi:hypothetical protein
MDVPPNTLFQVSLSVVDVLNAKPIATQRRDQPNNCFSASALILGLVTPRMAEYFSAWDSSAPTLLADYWERVLKFDGNTYTFAMRPIQSFPEITGALFPGCATFVGLRNENNQLGHMVVVSKDKNGNVAMIDLQQGKLLRTIDEIEAYVHEAQGAPMTPEGLASLKIGAFMRDTRATLTDILYFSHTFRSSEWLLTDARMDEIVKELPPPDADGNIPMLVDEPHIHRRRSHKKHLSRKFRKVFKSHHKTHRIRKY